MVSQGGKGVGGRDDQGFARSGGGGKGRVTPDGSQRAKERIGSERVPKIVSKERLQGKLARQLKEGKGSVLLLKK